MKWMDAGIIVAGTIRILIVLFNGAALASYLLHGALFSCSIRC
jgi:hypothetical protein